MCTGSLSHTSSCVPPERAAASCWVRDSLRTVLPGGRGGRRLTANEGFRERGLSPDYVVFHRGVCASAIRLIVGSSPSRRSFAETLRVSPRLVRRDPSATASARGTVSPPWPRRNFARPARILLRLPKTVRRCRTVLPGNGRAPDHRSRVPGLLERPGGRKRARFLAAGLTLQREAEEPSFNGLRTELDLFLNDELQDLKDRTKRQETHELDLYRKVYVIASAAATLSHHVGDPEQPRQPARPVRARGSEHDRGAHRFRAVPEEDQPDEGLPEFLDRGGQELSDWGRFHLIPSDAKVPRPLWLDYVNRVAAIRARESACGSGEPAARRVRPDDRPVSCSFFWRRESRLRPRARKGASCDSPGHAIFSSPQPSPSSWRPGSPRRLRRRAGISTDGGTRCLADGRGVARTRRRSRPVAAAGRQLAGHDRRPRLHGRDGAARDGSARPCACVAPGPRFRDRPI